MEIALTHKGYSIPKERVGAAETKKMIEDLTVCPKTNAKFITPAQKAQLTYKVYRESPTRWYLPRAYGIKTFGAVETDVVSEGLPLPAAAMSFKGTPYQYQTDIIDSFMNAGANGLICVPCGKGKTFMAIKIAATVGRRFLVIVDKEFLMNQWRGELEVLLPELRVGILQGPKAEVDPDRYDCTICMIQTLCSRDFDDTTFKNYGFAIFDECHHLGAQHFSKTLQKVQVKHMLGLSATPKREDGLTKVFFWFLGEPVYWEKVREPDPTVIVKSIMIKSDDVTYNTIPTDWRGETVMARLLGNILGCHERTVEIVRWIRLLCAEPDRKVLVLSERIGHLEEIEKLLEGAFELAYYVGGMKEAVREEGARTARVLLASYAMASEAMNIKSLNTVILASPRKNVEQSTGRILRTRVSERTVIPVIVDIVDSHHMYRSQWKKRQSYYKQCTYTMETWQHGAGAPDVAKKQKVEQVPAGCLIDD
uniref:Helicase ATP-binding domain-containing protein n=1 Tax=viral metagenome TaxID=1070528 RepID=A0A6C0JXS5_9ZZZZ